MSGIKRTPADVAFSKCIRARAGNRCERCGRSAHDKGLHASHHHGRGNWSIRFHPLNAEALCYGCHSHYGGTQQRREEVLTEAQQGLLFRLKEDKDLGRLYRKTKGKGEIAKYYRDELKRLEEKPGNFKAWHEEQLQCLE